MILKKKVLERKKMAVPYECPREYCMRAGVDVEEKILSSNTLSSRAILNTQRQSHLVTVSP